MSLEAIRARNKDGSLDRLAKAMGRTSLGNSRTNDEQEVTFYPERDKAGNGSAIIRFLPGLESEDKPYYVERFQHGVKHNGKWYIEFCPTTSGIDRNCLVCNYQFGLQEEYGGWKMCPKEIQTKIRPYFRTKGFRAGNYCNILVIKDPANPQNEGKVHLFKFGKAIMNMIVDRADPQDDGLGTTPKGVDIFDLDVGCNFKFIIRQKDGYSDYSLSSFEESTKCPEFDESTQSPLYPLVDKSVFKSDKELTARFNAVFNSTKRVIPSAEKAMDYNDDKKGSKLPEHIIETSKVDDVIASEGVSDEDNLAYFQDIAEEVNI